MPLVRIDMWPGTPREQKRELVRKVTEAVTETVGCAPDAVAVMLNEVDKADWARGGVCHDELYPARGGE